MLKLIYGVKTAVSSLTTIVGLNLLFAGKNEDPDEI